MQNFAGKSTSEHLHMSFPLSLGVIYLLIVTLIEISSTFKLMNDGVQAIQLPSPLSSERNDPKCFPKSLLLSSVSRDRRASISRPYFQQWRGSQEESRLGAKNLPAYVNRVGKRTYTVDNEQTLTAIDSDTPLAALFDHPSRQPMDIIYEDSTIICFSRSMSDAWAEEAMDKLRTQQHRRAVQDRPIESTHPFAFRYRRR
jgi:hypothetical protein